MKAGGDFENLVAIKKVELERLRAVEEYAVSRLKALRDVAGLAERNLDDAERGREAIAIAERQLCDEYDAKNPAPAEASSTASISPEASGPVGLGPHAELTEQLRGLLKAARCPNNACDGKGTIWDGVDPEQCEWCFERDAALKEDIPRVEGRVAVDGVHLIERERAEQVSREGWTPDHDDEHCEGEMASAALCYAEVASVQATGIDGAFATVPYEWPWDASWWKPKDQLRNLVRAGALIAAEIDRLIRAEAKRQDSTPEEGRS